MELAQKLLTKKAICVELGLISRSGKTIYYKKLRNFFFNDQALQEMNISLEEYESLKGGKPFSFSQSKRIIEYFDMN